MKKIWLVLLIALTSVARGADQTITAMPTNSAPASSDVVLSVDVSDTSQAATGTNKKLLLSGLGTFFEGSLNLQNFQGQVTDTQVPDTLTLTGTYTNLTLVTPTITGLMTFEDNVRQTFNPGVTTPGLNVGGYTGDPSAPSNGDLWYDSTGNLLRARINGATVSLGTGTGVGDVTAASAFGTDNRLIRSDGTGKGVQSTGITVDDSNNITGVTTLGATTTTTQTFSILDAVNQSHGLSFVVASDLTAAQTFTYTGAFNFGMTLTGNTSVTFPVAGTLVSDASTNSLQNKDLTNVNNTLPAEVGAAASDETTAITAGTGKTTFRMPFAMTVTSVRASLTTAQSAGSIFTVDINEGGTSIISTKLTIDNTEKTSTTAATAAVISDSAIADDAEITVDVDQIGTSGATGLKIWLIGTR